MVVFFICILNVILDEFSEFDPLIRMIEGTNFKKFIPDLEEYVASLNVAKKKAPKKNNPFG